MNTDIFFLSYLLPFICLFLFPLKSQEHVPLTVPSIVPLHLDFIKSRCRSPNRNEEEASRTGTVSKLRRSYTHTCTGALGRTRFGISPPPAGSASRSSNSLCCCRRAATGACPIASRYSMPSTREFALESHRGSPHGAGRAMLRVVAQSVFIAGQSKRRLQSWPFLGSISWSH